MLCWLGFHRWRWGCFNSELYGYHDVYLTCDRCGTVPAMMMVAYEELPISQCKGRV